MSEFMGRMFSEIGAKGQTDLQDGAAGWSQPPEARAMARALLLREPSAATLATVARATTPREMAALILGSPEFQRR